MRWIAIAVAMGCGSPGVAVQVPEPTASVDVVAAPAQPIPPARIERVRHDVEADDGHAIAVWEKSPSQPKGVIVLLHGRTWSGVPDFDLQVPGKPRSLMDALVGRGYATYAVDLRGYGGTPRDASGWVTPDRAEKDLSAVLQWITRRHEALGKPAVLGWSLGSLVAQLAAQRHPESMSALVLYGYPRDPDEPTKGATPTTERKPPAKANTAENAASDFISPKVIDQATVDAYVKASLAADPVRADWKDMHEFGSLDPARVHVPTLVLYGERDPYASVESQAKLFARLGNPDRAVVMIAGGDHAAHLEDTGPAFVHALVSFLERP